jgi:hypothetical protein
VTSRDIGGLKKEQVCADFKACRFICTDEISLTAKMRRGVYLYQSPFDATSDTQVGYLFHVSVLAISKWVVISSILCRCCYL